LQFREVVLVHHGLSAKAGDERLLAVLSLAHVADVALTGGQVAITDGQLGLQSLDLSVVFTRLLAHWSSNMLACRRSATRRASVSAVAGNPSTSISQERRHALTRDAELLADFLHGHPLRLKPALDGAVFARRPLILDLSACSFIDSSGLRAVLQVARDLTGDREERAVSMAVVAGEDSAVRKMLALTAIDLLVPVFESQDEANTWLDGSQKPNGQPNS
jgi:anti-anti-sigma factor